MRGVRLKIPKGVALEMCEFNVKSVILRTSDSKPINPNSYIVKKPRPAQLEIKALAEIHVAEILYVLDGAQTLRLLPRVCTVPSGAILFVSQLTALRPFVSTRKQ